MRSYLSDRKNRVCITGESSATTKMIFGMPQGSVVGPWMFTNYVLPIGDIIKHYGPPLCRWFTDIHNLQPKDTWRCGGLPLQDQSWHTGNQAMDDCQQVEVQWWETRVFHCRSSARSRSPIWLNPSTWWWQQVFSILQRALPRRSLWHQYASVRPGFSHMQNS